MVLLMGTPGPLRDHIAAALTDNGHETKVVAPDHEDPFACAVGSRAVVYLPSPSFDGDTKDTASRERMGAALSAAHAPGVEVVVALLPLTGFDDELDALAADGVPYVVLRVPMLIEELGRTLQDERWFFVARDEAVRAVAAEAVVSAIEMAIASEEQGRVHELGRVPLPAWAVLERAAESANKRVRVVSLWPPLARALHWLARLFRRRVPPALASCARFVLPPAGAT